VIWAAAVWIRPWRQPLVPDLKHPELAAEIVRRHGGDTLAPFTLRSDKEWFVTGQTLIAYRVVRGIALVSGDPVGPLDDVAAALDSFLAHAQARGWRTAILGASGRLLRVYRDRGLHPLYHGDEAVIDTAAFCLKGRKMRTVRQAIHRLERNGFHAEVVMAGDVTPAVRAELSAVEDAWLRGKARKGFTMELDSLFRLDGHGAAFALGRDQRGQVKGFAAPRGVPAQPVPLAVHHAPKAGHPQRFHRVAHRRDRVVGPPSRLPAAVVELLPVRWPARQSRQAAVPATSAAPGSTAPQGPAGPATGQPAPVQLAVRPCLAGPLRDPPGLGRPSPSGSRRHGRGRLPATRQLDPRPRLACLAPHRRNAPGEP